MKGAAEDKECEEGEEEYGELLKFTLAGFAGGLIIGAVLDWLGFQRRAWWRGQTCCRSSTSFWSLAGAEAVMECSPPGSILRRAACSSGGAG